MNASVVPTWLCAIHALVTFVKKMNTTEAKYTLFMFILGVITTLMIVCVLFAWVATMWLIPQVSITVTSHDNHIVLNDRQQKLIWDSEKAYTKCSH